MKFTTSVAMVDPAYYIPMAKAAEEAGFTTIVLPDSIGYPKESDSTYPYTPDGSREFLEDKQFIEPLIASATMAAVTEQIEFLTGVLKLPVRHPVLFAKELTSLAAITGGRFSLGVGTSPWPDDYEVVGLPWAGRGRRFDECVEIIRGLETGEYFEFHGEFYDFPAFKLSPAAPTPLKLIIGGHAETHIQRAARIGDGWMPAGMPTEQIASIVARIQEQRRELGRDHLPFEVHASNMDSASLDGIERLEAAGVTHTGGGFSGFNPYSMGPDTEPLQNKLDAIHLFGDRVISQLS